MIIMISSKFNDSLDALSLLTLQSIAGIMQASAEELELCPGLGPSKVCDCLLADWAVL